MQELYVTGFWGARLDNGVTNEGLNFMSNLIIYSVVTDHALEKRGIRDDAHGASIPIRLL